ncbi:DNA replication ATP-dependent helicase/nuclease JHS1-like isoform X1 [Prosopis cineraria]|uniref:DNA replication ATP-dependent helicase/nuclease JHS1-like isoform X1 n=1 Tax=Prosopis cineraria TaxID=364024 RepID=UPI00240EC230|nr:DNA replication ATP-dependent helicase/nuclease JHS1-like isoform X1 [Prosopis cineraria]
MPPRKKPSSSKKSNLSSQAQPSKFGIQHFFERHTQNALVASQKQPKNDPAANRPISAPQDSKSVASPNSHIPPVAGSQAVAPNNLDSVLARAESKLNSDLAGPKIENSESQKRKDTPQVGANEYNNVSQNTPSENLLIPGFDAVENLPEASPEISKIVPHKRFKFSPGMLIKQSQDDGVDEVTWKISPVNERLQAVSKHMPQMIQALAESSRINLLPVGISSENQTSLTKGGKFEKILASPSTKAAERSTVLKNEKGLKRINADQDMVFNVSSTAVNGSGVITVQSPFRTPPSLSYCSDKVQLVRDVEHNGLSDQLYLRQHKKALLELLDQVEDAICVEDATICDKSANYIKSQDGIADNLPIRVDSAAESTRIHKPKEALGGSSSNYLVLEVSEKHSLANSSALQGPYKVLRLINEQTGEEKAANLLEEWSYSVVAPGDTVNIIGQFDDWGHCDVDHDNNFLIVHPDILVSGSRVAASFTCPRRTVLDERLKCNEHSIAALTGTLLHQIFQAGLIKDSPSINFLEEYARLVLQRNIESLYACGVNENDVHKTLIDAIPRILNWIKLFKNSEEKRDAYVDFGCDDGIKKVKVSEVLDIEEMAWAPQYGLKGMIDASVSVKVLPKGNESDEKVMPLEFKTGKAMSGQSSIEHRAQVILYTLLMSERYLKTIDSGLLYYLQSDQTEGIVVQRSDLVGLIMRRNELASDILKALTTQQLPPMLQSLSICRGCRHLNVCSIYHKVQGGSAMSSGLGDVFDSHTNHLSSTYCKFLCHWDWLIDLEAKETEFVKKEMWRSHAFKSQNSTGLSSVILDASNNIPHQKSLKDNCFIYRFVRCGPSSLSEDGDPSKATANYLDLKLRSGDYVILSTESSRQAIASGVITDISHAHVSVSFSKRLRIPGSTSTSQDLYKQVWRIDKDEGVTSFAIMRFNLVQLFLQNARSTHLRKMIVDLEAPKFDSGSVLSQDPAISYVWSEKSLNDDQRRSILKILTAKDYALILGMPGTGKTSTMVHAVKALLIRGTTILLTAYTNSAVDNLLIKLKAQGIDFVRIGRHEAVHEEVRGHCLSATNVQNVDEIKVRLEQVKVVAVTCLGITSPLLANRTFDVCVMDEAGQTTLPVSLGPLMFSSMFVLVGDHYQLPPLVQRLERMVWG